MKKRKISIILISFSLIIVLLVGGFAIYVSDYYKATSNAKDALASTDSVEVISKKNEYIFKPNNQCDTGLIFYPGGKVEYSAYAPLMQEFANNNVMAILLKMPFNLAVFDINAADGIISQYPGISNWIIGGHSLGGSMAAAYLKNNHESFNGLLLLGSYSTTNLSNTNLKVVSIYGSNDNVMNKENYDKNISNLPKDSFYELIIDGGCHSYFADYGMQKNDGIASITLNQQIFLTVSYSVDKFLN